MKRPRCFDCNKFVRRLYIQSRVDGKLKNITWGWTCTSCGKQSTQSKCDHRTQVKQEINNIPMWICCDCNYINKIAIYDNKKNIFK